MNAITTVKAAEIVLEGASFDDWLSAGRDLARMKNRLGFMIGDWVNHGKEHFPEQLALALEQADIDPKLASSAATIAQAFPDSLRAKGLAFDHYKAVHKLPRDKAIEILSNAERDHLTLRQVRDAVTTERYESGDMFGDDDRDYYLQVQIIRAWNRGTPKAREMFLELATAANLAAIDEDNPTYD